MHELLVHTSRITAVLRDHDILKHPGRRAQRLRQQQGHVAPDRVRSPGALVDELLQALLGAAARDLPGYPLDRFPAGHGEETADVDLRPSTLIGARKRGKHLLAMDRYAIRGDITLRVVIHDRALATLHLGI